MAKHSIRLRVNGVHEDVEVPSNMTLLTLLREQLGLTGTKDGCSAGECGACTVMMNGEPVNSCMVLAVEVDGADILTVEGLSHDDQLDPLQEALIDLGATQCGFCTPGILISARALLDRNPSPTEGEIKSALRGNLCRCTGYVRIVRAVEQAAQGG
jgi:carbon-monoxide dehydrogenase small subunit